MSTISLIDEVLPTPRLPDAILASLRRSIFACVRDLQTGGLRIHDPDGAITELGRCTEECHELHVHDPCFYAYVAFGGTAGAGQAWVLGLWSCADPVGVSRLLIRERESMNALDTGLLARLRTPLYKLLEHRRRNTLQGSNRNIHAHYDLGNDFFALFLDESMTYSAGVFANDETSLAQAQYEKYDLICQKLALKPGDQLLEIGTGWGGMALHAARHYGVQVTTTTISQEQFELAGQRIEAAGLKDQITLLKQDYRMLQGQYDKVVSIEMIEAVGHEFLPGYFRKIDELLKPDGEALIQAITIQDQFYAEMCKGTDFIREHVFPGGHLPCVREMLSLTAAHTDLRLFDLEDFGQDYARTLSIWRGRFREALPQIRSLGYPPEFCRLWDFYLATCEAGFREASTSVVHAHFTKPQCRRERYNYRDTRA